MIYVFDSLWTVLLLYSVLNQFINIMKKWSTFYYNRSHSDSWGCLTKENFVYDSLWIVLLLMSVLNQFTNIMKRWSNVDSS